MSELDELVTLLVGLHRHRCFAMKQRIGMEGALKARLRIIDGYHIDLPAAERKRISALAAKLAKGNFEDFEDPDSYAMVAAALKGRQSFEELETGLTKRMEKAAAQLPVWEGWGKAVRGFGVRSLGVIVGEAYDLSRYGTKMQLWKRMGLGLVGDVRQGAPGPNATAEDWRRHGYVATRRATVAVIGDSLVKQGELYREVYLKRKEYERAQAEARGLTVLPAAKIPASKVGYMSEGHVHNRAQRYMEKRFLYDLWRAWRRTVSNMT